MPMPRSRRGLQREHRRFTLGSAAYRSNLRPRRSTMISAACAQLGERALVCAGWSDFSDLPHFEHVKVVSTMNFPAAFPACRAVVHHGAAGTTAAGLRAGVPALVLWTWPDQSLLGNTNPTIEGGYVPALFDHYPAIAGRGPSCDPRPWICHSGPRARNPDDQAR